MEDRGKILIGIAVIVFMIFIAYNFVTNISPYKTVTEVVKAGELKNVQVNGTIAPNSTVFFPENNTRLFYLTDGKSQMRVVFTGNVNYYRENVPVVVAGDYVDGTFKAYKLLIKCPSKYETSGNSGSGEVQE